MKLAVFALLFLFLFPLCALAEQLGSYKASNDKLYEIGDKIKLSRGSGQNGNFVYLTLGGLGLRGLSSQLDHTYTGSICTIKKIKKTNDERIIFIVGTGGLSNFELSIEDAIATCEIADCKNNTSTNIPSKFDELKKLKELLDAGAITEQEYQTEKAKLLK